MEENGEGVPLTFGPCGVYGAAFITVFAEVDTRESTRLIHDVDITFRLLSFDQITSIPLYQNGGQT